MFVGNNWDGTADVVDRADFQRLARLNVIPDKDAADRGDQADPASSAYFLAIRQASARATTSTSTTCSHARRAYVVVSRPSFADVVAHRPRDRRIVWRFPVEGYRSDHMGVSPDGTRVAGLGLDREQGRTCSTSDRQEGRLFASGDKPHENNYSQRRHEIWHASIGTRQHAARPTPRLDWTQGRRKIKVVDTQHASSCSSDRHGPELDEAGYPGMSSAVRPMALSPDERTCTSRSRSSTASSSTTSQHDKVLRVADLPTRDQRGCRASSTCSTPRHHGLAMNPPGRSCASPARWTTTRRSSTARPSRTRLVASATSRTGRPNSGDGKYCWVSVSGGDKVS